MALTWPTTFDVYNAMTINAITTKLLALGKKNKKMGEIKAMDLSVTNSIEAHDKIMHTKINHM